MAILVSAALALAISSSSPPESAPVATDLSYTMPIVGSWTYSPGSDGSEATFVDSAGNPQVTIRCTRSLRRVTILKAVATPSPSLWVWTSARIKSLPATYDQGAGRVSAQLAAFDPLLDALASSRGRIGFSTSGLAALVVPPWAEVGRVIEDCRV